MKYIQKALYCDGHIRNAKSIIAIQIIQNFWIQNSKFKILDSAFKIAGEEMYLFLQGFFFLFLLDSF